MNIERGIKNVKITNLTVKGLHGRYDYDVDFNTDLTFLFGSNGCGKTTILDILSSIITGELYRLFKYEFKTIDLYYSVESDIKNSICIKFNPISENPIIELIFMEESYSLRQIASRDELRFVPTAQERYFREYPILWEIKELFPFVYLPLNRRGSEERRSNKHRVNRELIRHTGYSEEMGYDVDDALFDAEHKISKFQHLVSQRKRELNDEFRDNLIKSFITAKNITQTKDAKNTKLEPFKVDFDKEIEEFKRVFNVAEQSIKGLEILSEKEFDEFVEDNNYLLDRLGEFQTILSKGSNISNEDLKKISYLMSNANRAPQIIEIAKITYNLQNNLEKEDHKLNSFRKTINYFFGEGEDAVTRKNLAWNAGKVIFRNNLDSEDIEIINLSSGEKQLFIFFAHLIFSLEESQPGILVVDEPELSLHLAWQREYVSKIMELQSNVQIIFATHAPELIGRYSDKAMKLSPKLTMEEGVK